MQCNASPKQRSGMGGGRGSDIRREATAEQSGYRPCRFDAPHFPHHAKQPRSFQSAAAMAFNRAASIRAPTAGPVSPSAKACALTAALSID